MVCMFIQDLSDRIKASTIELPILPEIAVKVTNLCSDPNSEIRDLVETIRSDQALMAELLKVANSALLGSSVPIVSLQLAVNRLGMARVRDIVMATTCKAQIFNLEEHAAVMSAMFKRAMLAGFIAQKVARKTRNNAEESFLAGLLQDIAMPILFREALEVEFSPGEDRDALIDQAMDELHAELGARLVASWNFPERIQQAIRFHHDPALADEGATLAQISRLARDLVDLVMNPDEIERSILDERGDAAQLNLYPDDLDDLIEATADMQTMVECLS